MEIKPKKRMHKYKQKKNKQKSSKWRYRLSFTVTLSKGTTAGCILRACTEVETIAASNLHSWAVKELAQKTARFALLA